MPDANGELQPVGLAALMGGYEHYWSAGSRRTRSTAWRRQQDEDYYADSSTRNSITARSIFIYWFLPDRAWAGVEYLYGRREVFDGEGRQG